MLSSSTSTAGDGVLVLLFLLPGTDGVVLLPEPDVVVRRVVLVVVLPTPKGPVVEISGIKFKRKFLQRLFTAGPQNVRRLRTPSLYDASVSHVGKVSQGQGMGWPVSTTTATTNAKGRLVRGSSQLKPQKTNHNTIQLVPKLLNAPCLLHNYRIKT